MHVNSLRLWLIRKTDGRWVVFVHTYNGYQKWAVFDSFLHAAQNIVAVQFGGQYPERYPLLAERLTRMQVVDPRQFYAKM